MSAILIAAIIILAALAVDTELLRPRRRERRRIERDMAIARLERKMGYRNTTIMPLAPGAVIPIDGKPRDFIYPLPGGGYAVDRDAISAAMRESFGHGQISSITG
jgi:hypothetical protein